MPDINELLQDEDFKKLSPQEQQDVVVNFASKNALSSSKVDPTIKDPGSSPTGALLNRLDKPTQLPFGLDESSIGQRVAGGITGAATGGLGGLAVGGVGSIPGAVGGGLLGALFPPKTLGQTAALAASGPAGGALSKGLSKAGPYIKPAVGGLMEMLGLNTLTEGVDRIGNATGMQKVPERDLLMRDQGLGDTAAQIGMATLPGILGGRLIKKQAEINPGAISNNLVKDVLNPNAKVSDLSKSRTIEHKSSELASTLGLTPEEIASVAKQKTKQKQLDKIDQVIAARKSRKSELTIDKDVNNLTKTQKDLEIAKRKASISESADPLKIANAGDNQIELNQAQFEERQGRRRGEWPEQLNDRDFTKTQKQNLKAQTNAEIIRKKSEMEAYGNQGKVDAVETRGKNTQIDLEKHGEDWKINRSNETKITLKQSLDDLKTEASNRAEALHGDLGILANYKNENELVKALGGLNPDGSPSKISASGVAAYRAKISKNIGQKGVDALENSMTEEFFRQAYDPNTKTLSKAPQVFEGNFTPDKIRAIFGNGPEAEVKLQRFEKGVEAIEALNNHGTSKFEQFTEGIKRHSIWILPNMAIMHPEVLGSTLATTTVLLGTASSAIYYPKLMNKIITDKKWGDNFYKWSTSTTREGRSLANWPRLASWMRANSEQVEVPTEE